MTILDEILDRKREEVAEAKRRVSPADMRADAQASSEATRGFAASLARAQAPAIIAELKRQSPSKGLIREDFEPISLARAYEEGGAAALSVLTDTHFFGGELAYLSRIRAATALPLLRKDFIIDAYQIDEARVAGADAVLLIVAALPPAALGELHAHAASVGLDALVEVHDPAELKIALSAGAHVLGVNNRDLRSFEVDLGVFEAVAGPLAGDPNFVLVAESGIHDAKDVARLEKAGARAFLVGESLMRCPDVAGALKSLRRKQ